MRFCPSGDPTRPARAVERSSSHDDVAFNWQPEPSFDEAVKNLHQDLTIAPWDEQTFSDFVSATLPSWPAVVAQPDGNSDYASASSSMSPVSGGVESRPCTGSDSSLSDYPGWSLEHFINESNELVCSSLTPTAPVAPAPVAQMLPRSVEEPQHHDTDRTGHMFQSSDCLAKATSLLLALSRQRPFAVTSEAVLQRNREVIDEMTRILACDCSRDGYLASVLGLVLFKLLAWYSAAAYGADQMQATTSACGTASWMLPTHSTLTSEAATSLSSPTLAAIPPSNLASYTKMLSQPVYSCGYESGEALIQQPSSSAAELRRSAQEVMKELHHTQRLMKLLASRASERRFSQDFMNIDHKGEEEQDLTAFLDFGEDVDTSQLSESMLNHIEGEVRKRFRLVCGATIQRLRIM